MKNTIRTLILLAAPLLFISWANNWDDLKKSTGGISSIQADFVQRKEMKMLAKPLVSRGRMLFSAPDSLRWEYTSPEKSVLLVHGGDVERYVMENGTFKKDTATGLQSMRIVFSEIIMWLNGKFDANPDFEAKLVTGGTNRIVLTPKRKSMSRYVRAIELTLTSRPGVISRVKIDEGNGNHTLLTFTSVILNRPLPSGTFEKP